MGELIHVDVANHPRGEGHVGARVVEVARDDMGVDMRDAIAEHLVVQVTGREHLVQASRYCDDVVPEPSGLLFGEFGEVSCMAAVKRDNRIARLRPSPLQVAVTKTPDEEPNAAALIFLGPATHALRASLAATAIIPVVGPLGLIHRQVLSRGSMLS